tara:strand:+ start:529 stop:1095 length:567 start_codon:yes stop_codon:yes gene_type:complete
MYTTAGTEEKEFVSKYIEPGVHIVKITGMLGAEPESGAPYLQIDFENAKEQTANIRFYMSEKAKEMSTKKIIHLFSRMVTKKELDKIKAKSLEDYGSKLNTLFSEKSCRVKFTGEEVDGNKGTWWKAGIGLPTFAEATSEGAEHAPISNDNSKLFLNKENKYDWKPLPTANVEISNDVSNTSEEDAPF